MFFANLACLTLFELQRKSSQEKVGGLRICQICGDGVGLTATGELFVACNECAFPICRTCYEYERREGNQLCPQCKTRFKRLKGKDTSYFYTMYRIKIARVTGSSFSSTILWFKWCSCCVIIEFHEIR